MTNDELRHEYCVSWVVPIGVTRSYNTRWRAREAADEALRSCENANHATFATGENETSNEDSHYNVYSQRRTSGFTYRLLHAY